MHYPINIKGLEGHEVVLSRRTVFNDWKLLVDGAAPLTVKKNRYTVTLNSGEEANVELKSGFIDPLPSIKVNDLPISYARPFELREWAWLCAPILIVLYGGLIGAMVGLIATMANGIVFRTSLPKQTQLILTGAIAAAALGITWIIEMTATAYLRSIATGHTDKGML